VSDTFVVDNSVVMAWCFEDECSDYAEAVLERLVDQQALVPAIWPLEVANVLLAAERRKRINPAQSTRFVQLLTDLPITVVSQDPAQALSDVLALGRTSRLSSYDASYLDLAIRRGLPLASRDDRLRKAAKRCKVKLL